MTTTEATTLFKYHLQTNHEPGTIESYSRFIERSDAVHGERLIDAISPDEIFHFLENLTRGLAVIQPHVPAETGSRRR